MLSFYSERENISRDRFVYPLGYAGFGILLNPHFHAAGEALCGYGNIYNSHGEMVVHGANTLSVWNMSHKRLDAADVYTAEAVGKMVDEAHGRCFQTDGWNGLQRKHVLYRATQGRQIVLGRFSRSEVAH